jgi:heparinase II/III-like protein/uncharacterized protein DUF4962
MLTAAVLALALAPAASADVPSFDALLRHEVKLRPELVGVHPRVFVTKDGLEALRARARTTHREEWQRVLAGLAALKTPPPPAPGPQERRSQNVVAFAIAEAALAASVERRPEYVAAAKQWTLAAIDYEPWGYTYNKPNVDLAAGHLLYAIGWAYDLLHDDFAPDERARIRASLTRHAGLVYDHFAPGPGKRSNFTQNHDFIPTAGLAVAALALLGEAPDAPRWAALARAHHHRAGTLLSPDGHYYEGFEYWIFSTPWLVHFLDAWEHATGESLWDREVFGNWKLYLAHALLPDGQTVVDFGDIWEGALTRAGEGADHPRVYPGGTLQSNFNVMYRVAARLRDPQAQAVAERYASYRHSNLEEYWTLLWRDPALQASSMDALPLAHHFADSGVVYARTSWRADATAFAFKAGPPEGHRVASLLARAPEWKLSSGHAHPDAGSFVVWARGRYLVGDTGYAGLPSARDHNTLTFGGVGQGREGEHDVWAGVPYAQLDRIRISDVRLGGAGQRVVADLTAAYPASLGLERVVRTFTFDGTGAFRVEDEVVARGPVPVEWRLHADVPFVPGPSGHAIDVRGVALDVAAQGTSSATTAQALLQAPGRPGSIEQGPKEPRGFELVLARPAAPRHAFDVTLRVRD